MTRTFDLNCLKTERLHLSLFVPVSQIGGRWEKLSSDIESLVTEELEEWWASTEQCWLRGNNRCDAGLDIGNGQQCPVCSGEGELTITELAGVLRSRSTHAYQTRNFCVMCWDDPCRGTCGSFVDIKEAA